MIARHSYIARHDARFMIRHSIYNLLYIFLPFIGELNINIFFCSKLNLKMAKTLFRVVIFAAFKLHLAREYTQMFK